MNDAISQSSTLSSALSSAPSALDLSIRSLENARSEVQGFYGDPLMIERLKEMGIHQGIAIEFCGKAPFGGPHLFRMGATVIALRHEEAQCIRIQKL